MYRTNKYGNRKTEVDGIKFDSQKEANRYAELKLMERGGLIKDLELQPRFELMPKFERMGEKFRKMEYVADFRYIDIENGGIEVVEDVKGMKTDVYKLKKKLLLFRYEDFVFTEI